MQTITSPTMISAADAARRLGLSPARVYAFCACGILRAEREGRRVLIEETSVQDLAARRRNIRLARKPRQLRLVVNNDK